METAKIENFSCSTDGKFGFRFKQTYYNCEFAGGKNVKVEYNPLKGKGPISKEFECTPIEYDNYYDFCLNIAGQILKQMEE